MGVGGEHSLSLKSKGREILEMELQNMLTTVGFKSKEREIQGRKLQNMLEDYKGYVDPIFYLKTLKISFEKNIGELLVMLLNIFFRLFSSRYHLSP